MISPSRGEIWLINLDPTQGKEIQKTRPAVVISTEIFRSIPIRIIIPTTSWQDKFVDRPFMVKIQATPQTGLDKDSAGNALQVRSLSTERFRKRLGTILPDVLSELLAGLIICIDYE